MLPVARRNPGRATSRLSCRHIFRPFLCAVKHTKNSNCRLSNGISRDIRRTIDNEFACPSNSAHAPTRRKSEQTTGGRDYPLIYQNGRRRIICLDVCEDGIAIR